MILCIRNTRFSLQYSRLLREVCVLAYVIGTVFSLTLKNSCAQYSSSKFWCPQQMYWPCNLCCPPKLLRSPSNDTICVRNNLQSVDIKIGHATCPMQSLATKTVTRQTSGYSRVILFSVKTYSRVTGFVTMVYIYQLERPNLIDTLTQTLATTWWARGNDIGVDSPGI